VPAHDRSGTLGERLCQRPLPGQLAGMLGFEFATLSPRTVNLADRVSTRERDDSRDAREHKHADCGNNLQYDDHGDDRHDHGEDSLHGADYRPRG
jgi:hypothetical protein